MSQHWALTESRRIDTQARKIISENGGKHPLGSTALLYLPRETGGCGLKSVEMEYKQTKGKAAVRLYSIKDSTLQLVREFEKHASTKGGE